MEDLFSQNGGLAHTTQLASVIKPKFTTWLQLFVQRSRQCVSSQRLFKLVVWQLQSPVFLRCTSCYCSVVKLCSLSSLLSSGNRDNWSGRIGERGGEQRKSRGRRGDSQHEGEAMRCLCGFIFFPPVKTPKQFSSQRRKTAQRRRHTDSAYKCWLTLFSQLATVPSV